MKTRNLQQHIKIKESEHRLAISVAGLSPCLETLLFFTSGP